jgi:pimeloyl-ACP methyl ester carboxylesterase
MATLYGRPVSQDGGGVAHGIDRGRTLPKAGETVKLYFDDPEFDLQLQRTFAKAVCRVCDVGEVFAVAHRIEPGNLDSWYNEWSAAGASNQQLAERSEAAKAKRDAGDAFLRASECYRSAYFFCRREPHGERLLKAFRASRALFRRAIPNLPVDIDRVEIPYEGIAIPGYVVWGVGGRSGPTVLIPSGYDSPVEESYSLGALEAALRGMNVVMFGGPGQGEMLYESNIPFRHDFEAVVRPVIDFVESHDGLASDRIALIGRSFGGYLAPRAAASEHRIGVLTADPAQTDMFATIKARLPAEWLKMVEANDPAFNDALWKANPGVDKQEFWMSRIRAHGLEEPLDYVREMKKWVVDVEAIACPTYVSYGEGDFAQATAADFYKRLDVPKHFEMFKDADGSGGHCEGMGQSRYYAGVFGFIQDHLPD